MQWTPPLSILLNALRLRWREFLNSGAGPASRFRTRSSLYIWLRAPQTNSKSENSSPTIIGLMGHSNP